MQTTIHIHPDGYEVKSYTGGGRRFVCVEMNDGPQHQTAIFLSTPEECDEHIKAAVLAKSMMLGETSEPVTAADDAGRAIAADLDVQAGPRCPASRIGFGPCALRSFHPGWHENLVGAGWPQYDEDIELDAALTGDAYRLPAAEVTR